MLANYHGVDDMSIEGQSVLMGLVNHDHYHEAKTLLEVLLNKNFSLDSGVLTKYMRLAQKQKDYDVADDIAEYIASVEPVPDRSVWETRMIAMLHHKKLNEAITLVEQANDLNVPIASYMYLNLLKNLVHDQRSLDVYSLWMTMQKLNIPCDATAYAYMIRFAGDLGMQSDALNYYELSKCGGTEAPNDLCLYNLLMALTSVDFNEINLNHLFYIMNEAHKYQIIPTQMMYFQVIKTFCRLGDTVNAEFYFFELLRNYYPGHNLSKRKTFHAYEKLAMDQSPADVHLLFFWLLSAYRLRCQTILNPSQFIAPMAVLTEPLSSSGVSLSKKQTKKISAAVLKDLQPYSEEETLYRESASKWRKIYSRITEASSFFTSPFTVVHAEKINVNKGDNVSDVTINHQYNPKWAFQRLDQVSERYSPPPVDLSLEQCVHRGQQIYQSMSKFDITPDSAVRKEYLLLLAVAGRVEEAEAHFQIMCKSRFTARLFQPDYAIMICMYNEVKDYAKAHAIHKEARNLGLAMRSDVMSFRLHGAASEVESDANDSTESSIANDGDVMPKFKKNRRAQLQTLGGDDLLAMQRRTKQTDKLRTLSETMEDILRIDIPSVSGSVDKPSLSDSERSSRKKLREALSKRPKVVIEDFLKSIDIDVKSILQSQSASLNLSVAPQPQEEREEDESLNFVAQVSSSTDKTTADSPPLTTPIAKTVLRATSVIASKDKPTISTAQSVASRIFSSSQSTFTIADAVKAPLVEQSNNIVVLESVKSATPRSVAKSRIVKRPTVTTPSVDTEVVSVPQIEIKVKQTLQRPSQETSTTQQPFKKHVTTGRGKPTASSGDVISRQHNKPHDRHDRKREVNRRNEVKVGAARVLFEVSDGAVEDRWNQHDAAAFKQEDRNQESLNKPLINIWD